MDMKQERQVSGRRDIVAIGASAGGDEARARQCDATPQQLNGQILALQRLTDEAVSETTAASP